VNIEKIINLELLNRNPFLSKLLPILAVSAVLISNYLAFVATPPERVMGAVQKIFYFHVGSAMAAYLMLAILFVASLFFLATRKNEWDILGNASASVAFIFCSIVLVTGMIWGHSAWNTWWRWEPRLVSFLILWLIVLSLLLLRGLAEDSSRKRNYLAVLGIISAINVPIVMFSIKMLDHIQQLHPEVVASNGLADSSYVVALVVSILSLALFSLWLLLLKTRNVLLQEESEQLRAIINLR
jgi:heme exporter protein C